MSLYTPIWCEFLGNNVKCKTTIQKGYIWFYLLKRSGNNEILDMENVGCLCRTSYHYKWNASYLRLGTSILQSSVDDFIVVTHHAVFTNQKGQNITIRYNLKYVAHGW